MSYNINNNSLVAQMIKNLPDMWETWVQSLGWVYTVSKKQDWELTVAQIMNPLLPNSDLN